jgi:hypothetical protein
MENSRKNKSLIQIKKNNISFKSYKQKIIKFKIK